VTISAIWKSRLWAIRLVVISCPRPVRSRAFSAAMTDVVTIEAVATSLTAMV
jgi:hypothetical protein